MKGWIHKPLRHVFGTNEGLEILVECKVAPKQLEHQCVEHGEKHHWDGQDEENNSAHGLAPKGWGWKFDYSIFLLGITLFFVLPTTMKNSLLLHGKREIMGTVFSIEEV